MIHAREASVFEVTCFPFSACCVCWDVHVQYVRREIRQLHDADREEFFDTMETLYRLSTAEGVHLYGSEYKVSVTDNRLLVACGMA